MILAFEPDKRFEAPEGVYSAALDEVKELRKAISEGVAVYIRFVWRVDSLCTKPKIVLAGKNYAPILNQTSELRLMLETWLGKDWVEQHQKAGKIDFESLYGRKADLAIKLIKNSSHKTGGIASQERAGLSGRETPASYQGNQRRKEMRLLRFGYPVAKTSAPG